MKKKGFFYRTMMLMGIVAALALFLCLLVPWMPAETYPAYAFLSLIVPFVILINTVLFAIWLFIKRKIALLLAVPLVLSVFVLKPFFKLTGHSVEEAIEGVKILSFNTRKFNAYQQLQLKDADQLILDFVTAQDPDIACFQEFYHGMKESEHLSQYDYKFIDYSDGEPQNRVIQAIYSKYPILGVSRITFPKSSNSAIYADIEIDKDTVRVYNLHLQSFNIVPDFKNMEKQKYRKIMNKIKHAMRLQKQQVGIIREHLASSPYTTLIVGDFNATQYSNAYHTLTEGFSDSYFKAGKGFGRTYDLKGYPMRIDYILGDGGVEFHSHRNYDHRYSDHYPLMAGFKLVENK